MLGALDSLNLATDVELLGLFPEVLDARVGNVIRAHNGLGLFGLVVSVDVLDSKDSEDGLVSRVTQGDADVRGEGKGINVRLGNIEGDGHGEESTIGETKGISDAECGNDDQMRFRSTRWG